jgi:predicted transcriptional regulator
MIVTTEIRKEQAEKRALLRCSSETLTNVITEGTNCSFFEAKVITQKAKEVFKLDEYAPDAPLQPGQMVWQAIDQNEPPGKPLEKCKFHRIVLTIHRLEEDREAYCKFGASARRQQQIARIAEEALQQETLLTLEEIAILLSHDESTIRRDAKTLRDKGFLIPTRGNKKDIGPGVTHRQKTIELFIKGHEPLEISNQIKHALKSVERYIQSFCRVVYTQRMTRDSLQTALITGFSMALVNRCLELRDQVIKTDAYKSRLDQIEENGAKYWEAVDSKKKASQFIGRQK